MRQHRCWCGEIGNYLFPVGRRDGVRMKSYWFCIHHHPESPKRRRIAGEMGIKLAEKIFKGYLLDLPGWLVDDAQSILNALEGKS